jgi:cell division inhibitor SepF
MLIGVGPDEDDEVEEKFEKKSSKKKHQQKEEEEVPNGFESPFAQGTSRKPVVNVYSQKKYNIQVIKPYSFEESKLIAEHLKQRRIVVVNFDKTEDELAQRMVDFISGATYALDGEMQKVGDKSFMFVPSNFEIENEISMHTTEREMPWMKPR